MTTKLSKLRTNYILDQTGIVAGKVVKYTMISITAWVESVLY